MSFRSWRERKLLSQERVAEMSGLSLRTVQRLDAGHRVSYASLRALAATFEIDVDQLERDLYAVNKATDDFVEVPRWVRILDDTRWFGGHGLSRRDAHLLETIIVGGVVIFFVASFLVSSEGVAKILRVGAAIELVAAYMVSRYIRTSDKYRLWSDANGGATEPKQLRRTWQSIAAEYTYFFGVGLLSIVILCWVAF